MTHDDFAVEPIAGLPSLPPRGETILWQGSPDWRLFARRVFHLPLIGAYFALVAGWRLAVAVHDGESLAEAALGAGFVMLLACVTLCFLAFLSFAIARSTVYTLTSRRIVMRFGVALPMSVNLPFAQIEAAALRSYAHGYGNIALRLSGERPLSYAVLWPHARPWRFTRPEPMLRCIPQAERVARLLAEAFARLEPARLAREEGPARAAAAGRTVAAVG